MEPIKDLRLAVLIDADNVPYANVKGMLAEIAKYGTPTFRRIYADWTRPTVSGWKTVLLENAITPVQQYSYTTGKNSSDSALIIDAMDILYTGRVDGFCIVSSDSDFTRLATRLKEAGMKVFGLGEKKTPTAFISACDKFIYIEILKPAEDAKAPVATPRARAPQRAAKKAVPAPVPAPSPVATVGTLDKRVLKLLSASISDLADEHGWAFLGELGNLILKKQPDFDPRNYGFKKLMLLLKSIDQFEVEERTAPSGNMSLIYVRNK